VVVVAVVAIADVVRDKVKVRDRAKARDAGSVAAKKYSSSNQVTG